MRWLEKRAPEGTGQVEEGGLDCIGTHSKQEVSMAAACISVKE